MPPSRLRGHLLLVLFSLTAAYGDSASEPETADDLHAAAVAADGAALSCKSSKKRSVP